MASITIDLDVYKDGLPTHVRYRVDALRIGFGAPPGLSRDEHVAALLRIAEEALGEAATKLERSEPDGEYTTHFKIPKGEW